MPDKFTITKHDNGYYCVSIPSYQGGNVVHAEDYEALRALNAVQADSIKEFQREQRLMLDALRGVAIMLNTELERYNDEPWAQRVRAAITPKGEQKQGETDHE